MIKKINRMKYVILGIALIAIIGLPATILFVRNQQEIRSRAAPSTTLYFLPSTSEDSPQQAQVGQTLNFDLMIDPGSNLPSVVKLNLNYDPTKIEIAQTGFLTNLSAFTTTLEGPFLNETNGTLNISLSIGADTTKAIQEVTKVGTLTVKTLSPTNGTPTQISFGNSTLVLSVASTDYSTENILSASNPAFIEILAPPTPTPTPTPAATTFNITAYLHGIGNSGDNSNPNDYRLSNKSPQHLEREATLYIYDNQNQLVSTGSGKITYDPDPNSGNYKGLISVNSTLTPGQYIFKAQTSSHLRRQIPGIQTISPNQENTLPAITFIAGDINNDNILNILDYNILIGCYSDLLPPKSCTETNKTLADLNDDGFVNQVDYNLFLREISTQIGN